LDDFVRSFRRKLILKLKHVNYNRSKNIFRPIFCQSSLDLFFQKQNEQSTF